MLAQDRNNKNHKVPRIVKASTTLTIALTDPVLAPLRRVIPCVGSLDLTVLVLFLIIQFVRGVIIPEAADFFR